MSPLSLHAGVVTLLLLGSAPALAAVKPDAQVPGSGADCQVVVCCGHACRLLPPEPESVDDLG